MTKCFIHGNEVSVATCRRCGKEMCENCFAYGGHSGICPSCLWMEYLAERDCLEEEQRGFRRGIVGWALFAAGLCWTVAGLIYGICKINRKCRRKKEVAERLASLDGEIKKIDRALADGVSAI